MVGVFDGNPAGRSDGDAQVLNAHGTNFNLRSGAFVIGEVQYALNAPPADPKAPQPAGLPGTYKLGFCISRSMRTTRATAPMACRSRIRRATGLPPPIAATTGSCGRGPDGVAAVGRQPALGRRVRARDGRTGRSQYRRFRGQRRRDAESAVQDATTTSRASRSATRRSARMRAASTATRASTRRPAIRCAARGDGRRSDVPVPRRAVVAAAGRPAALLPSGRRHPEPERGRCAHRRRNGGRRTHDDHVLKQA